MYALYLESHFPENDYMYVYDWNGVSMQLSVHIRVLYQMCTCTVRVLHSSEFIEQSSLHIQSTYSTAVQLHVCVYLLHGGTVKVCVLYHPVQPRTTMLATWRRTRCVVETLLKRSRRCSGLHKSSRLVLAAS